jgi:FMN hydrolase / 5-amino-6-(5-phospho-D-ribitylamino)uracil phosphatase
MKHIRFLTFDLDDTLWDNRPVLLTAERSLYDWLARHYPRIGEHYTVESMREQRLELARLEPQLRHHMTALRKRSLQLAAESVGYDHSLVEPAFECFLEARHQITPFADVVPALQKLRAAGYLLGSLTNGNADVSRLGLGHLFHLSISAESVGSAKPDPGMFEQACREAGVDAGEMAHIGDEPETDIAGALAAGATAIWMNRFGRPMDPTLAVHATVHDMRELLALFGVIG